MNKRIKVGILFGGRSVEHEISILSAKNVYKYIDQTIFEPVLIGIDKEGTWYTGIEPGQDFSQGKELNIKLQQGKAVLMDTAGNRVEGIEVIFPVLHGTDGEDGSIQGLLQALGIPCVGSGVLGSALCMDKIYSKRLLEAENIPVADYFVLHKRDEEKISLSDIVEKIGLPMIAKPASLGSSVGVSKVKDEATFLQACEEIFTFDDRILFEEFVQGRELECAVMGNHEPVASEPGEVIINGDYEFYTFEAKYVDKQATKIEIPAKVTAEDAQKIKENSVRAYQALGCEDFSRVDIFLTEDGRALVNEINTIPGFTDISMFPSLWAHEGIAYKDLLTRLIRMACEREEEKKKLATHFNSALNK